MEITLHINDDIFRELRKRASREGKSSSQLVNELLRKGLAIETEMVDTFKRKFRQKTYNMGQPKFHVTKALALADALGDEEIIAKMKDSMRQSSSKSSEENQ